MGTLLPALRTFSLFTILCLSLVASASGQDPFGVLTTHVPSALPTLETIKSCLKETASAECLDRLYREGLREHTTIEALQQIQNFEAADPDLRRDCHLVVHSIGRETFRLKGNIHDSFFACDQTCHSGCYHGSVERFLRGEDIYSQSDRHPTQSELKQKAATACDPNAPQRLRFQCLHGLGHALLFFSRYQLKPSLEACDALPDHWARSSCYGGVFMENVSSATPEKRDLSKTDYHYPCNAIDPKYRNECYLMQTSRMAEMGLSTTRMLEECEQADEHRVACTISIGRDLSNEVRLGRRQAAAEKCELVTGTQRLACMRGVIYALVDNTWDARYALPFCTAFSRENDQNTCVGESFQYLKVYFDKSPDDLIKECSRHSAQPERCAELAALQHTQSIR